MLYIVTPLVGAMLIIQLEIFRQNKRLVVMALSVSPPSWLF